MFVNSLGAICLMALTVGSVRSQDKGYLRSCDPALYQISVDWTPSTFQSGAKYTISVNATAAKMFTRGQLCLKIWLRGISDPIYDDCKLIDCRDVLDEGRKYTNHELKCPIRPGDRVYIANSEFTIDPTTPLPGGHFHLNATIDNENNERFLCVTGDLDIANDFDEDF